MFGSAQQRIVTEAETVESIVRRVTREVWLELARKGKTPPAGPAALPDGAVRLDMSKYRTPVLTERALMGLHNRTHTVVAPAGTVVTPRAKELVRDKRITIVYE